MGAAGALSVARAEDEAPDVFSVDEPAGALEVACSAVFVSSCHCQRKGSSHADRSATAVRYSAGADWPVGSPFVGCLLIARSSSAPRAVVKCDAASRVEPHGGRRDATGVGGSAGGGAPALRFSPESVSWSPPRLQQCAKKGGRQATGWAVAALSPPHPPRYARGDSARWVVHSTLSRSRAEERGPRRARCDRSHAATSRALRRISPLATRGGPGGIWQPLRCREA